MEVSRAQPAECAVAVVGAVAVDVVSQPRAPSDSQSTTPGTVTMSLGGVGRNVAEASHRTLPEQHESVLISPIGSDYSGKLVVDGTRELGMRTSGLFHVSGRTAVINMFLDHEGNLLHGVADTEVLDLLEPEPASQPNDWNTRKF